MSACVTGKNCYHSQAEGEQALIENRIRYHHSDDAGPQNIYLCDDCGSYHFTSRGPMNEVLRDQLDYIKKQRVARDWESRLR
ncbi:MULTISPECIES: hypothetical protein [Reichenbachiella]|uniref:Uncharacterized protein n=1 Tax=Reichenbachiella agariperforans TaxID=156994 RepID=A0A1M6NY34_REIAG|nr:MULTISPECIES: hypothetical protein [Reichenbachiella]MBU2916087.1 hypothetical protein [Reichenbachiella agariperforans]RJE71672.1 hypothetical protein BGP76_06175 [Reichenbachiella sp. MSK19-1]SHK00562.1 hypothetical protein SAMN04488028_102462 [Reichenbachiella agariperforans]